MYFGIYACFVNDGIYYTSRNDGRRHVLPVCVEVPDGTKLLHDEDAFLFQDEHYPYPVGVHYAVSVGTAVVRLDKIDYNSGYVGDLIASYKNLFDS